MMEIQFRADREELLRKLCAEMGRTVDDFAGEAILTFMEDYEDGRDAEAVMRRVRSGEETLIPLEEVMKQYDLVSEHLSDGTEAIGSARSDSTETHTGFSSSTASHAA